MNLVILIGNLTRDPEVKQVGPKGTSVCNFGIATNRKYKVGDEKKEEVCFVDCTAWDTGADLIGEYFAKGDPILIHGELVQETWEDKETGKNRSKLKVRVSRFEFLPSKKDGKSSNGKKRDEPASTPAEDVPPSGDNDDVPF